MNLKIIVALLMLSPLLQGCAVLLAGGAAATGVAVVHDRRTAGTVLEDQTIEIKVRGALASDKEIHAKTHLSVTSYNGIVLLSGEAPSAELRRRAAELASTTDKVRRVHNEVEIAAPSSLTSRSADTLLTAKVKARLLATKNLDSSRFKAVTEGGTVYLLGLVTRAEAEVAADQTSQVDGVQRVVTIFEYVDV